MTLLSKAGTPRVSTPNPAPNHRHSGWLAGETLAAGDACTVHSDGRVYRASGAAADAEARIYGWTAEAAPVGEAATLYDHVNLAYSSGLTPGTVYYLSATTPGGLDTDPTPGCPVPCAVAVDATRIHVHSNWSGAAQSDPLVVHAWAGTATIIDDTGSPRLIVGAETTDANAAYATMVVGNDQDDYGLNAINAYSGNGVAVNAVSSQWMGVYGEGATYGITGSTDAGAGIRALSNSGPALKAYSGTGPAVFCQSGWMFIADQSEPPTPSGGIVVWSASGVMKWKGPDGVVH